METVKKISSCQELRKRKTKVGRAQRNLNETIPKDTIMVDTYHYTFVKINRIYNIKNEP